MNRAMSAGSSEFACFEHLEQRILFSGTDLKAALWDAEAYKPEFVLVMDRSIETKSETGATIGSSPLFDLSPSAEAFPKVPAISAEQAAEIHLETLGVSDGVSWFQNSGEIETYGGDYTYAVDLEAGQHVSASVQTPEAGGDNYGNFAYMPIPDDETPVTSEIFVSESFVIEDLDVVVCIEHDWAEDLDIFLIAPGGAAKIELSTDNGGWGYDYYTRFDDESPIGIDDPLAGAPFIGRFSPESPLSALDGGDAAGAWRLEITDDEALCGGELLYWQLAFNSGLDPMLTILGPSGEIAFNDDAVPGATDSAVADVVVPETGTYYFEVGAFNAGGYNFELGVHDAATPGETGDTTDMDPLRAGGNGNATVRAMGDGVGESDVFTATLNAGESVVVAATTPGGFYDPRVTVTGPGGFAAEDDDAGRALDAFVPFTAPATGLYTITVDTLLGDDYLDALASGSYALSLLLVDNAANGGIAGARPVSTFDYGEQLEATSDLFDVPGVQGLWLGEIDSESDFDYFDLGDLPEGEVIRITGQRDGGGLFAYLELRNGAGELIDPALPAHSGGAEGTASFEIVIPEADTYFAVITGDLIDPGGLTFSTGGYALFYSRFGSVEDPYEDNDSKAVVDALPPGGAGSANLGVIPDVRVIGDLTMLSDSEDWFRFETPGQGRRGDRVRIDFEHDDGDLDLELLDSAGAVIGESASTEDGEVISLHGLPAGVYYARIHGYDDAANPDYSLKIQTQSPEHRLLSAPFTTDAAYTLNYEVLGAPGSSVEQLQMGANEFIVTHPGSGADPFELLFEVTRVGSMADRTSYQYDQSGYPSRKTDALGRDTTYVYDGLGRLNGVSAPDLDELVVYTYDGNDNRTGMFDNTGFSVYLYDELDRLDLILLPDDLGIIDYEHDLAGRVTSITYPDATEVLYAYDRAGRLASVTEGSDVTSYTYYSPSGLLHTVSLPNGVTASYDYDAYSRLSDLAYTDSAGRLVTSFHYTLDANGNRTAMEVRRQDASTPGVDDYVSGVYGYSYDPLNRLIEAGYPDATVVTYTYDANGNRLSAGTDPDGAGPNPAVVENYHYGQDNRLERISGPGGATIKEFHYDPRGNVVMVVTPTETVHYEYDYRNLLVAVDDGTDLVQYEYNGDGDRVARVVNGERTTYVNDINRDFTQVLLELDDTGATQARYTYGLGRISGVLPGETDSSYYVADALGSTTDLTDPTGAVLTSYNYDAFGTIRTTDPAGGTGAMPNTFLFTGENVDPDTGLVYLRARYYDPSTGRFVSKDPSGFVDGANVYLYGGDNPSTRNDPTGHSWRDWAGYATTAIDQGMNAWGRYLATAPITRLSQGGLLSSNNYSRLGGRNIFVGEAAGFWRGANIVGAALGGWEAGTSWNSYFDTASRYTRGEASASDLWHDWGVAGAKTLAAPFGLGFLVDAWDSGTSWLANTIYGNNRGGVLLNRAVDLVGDLESITGATVDPVTGQVVLLGTEDSGGAVPDLRLDDFITAVRAVFGSAEDPGVTIDPQSSNPSVPQLVHLFGGLDDTEMGWVLFEADRVMKTLVAGEDNVTGSAVSSSAPNYSSLLYRWFQRAMTHPHDDSGDGESRFWFVPTDVKLVRSDDGQSFVFDQAAVQLMTEDMLVGGGATDPDAENFADWFNRHFDYLAGEEFTTYDYPSEYANGAGPVPAASAEDRLVFRRLEQCAKAIAFARFLYDNDIPIDFSWMENHEVPSRNTPLEARTVRNSMTGHSGGYRITITVTGGVTMETPNSYLIDTGAADDMSIVTLSDRPDELTQEWTTSFDGQELKAVALSLDSTHYDGLDSRADTDLSYQTAGDVLLGLTRYYSSASPVPGAFGYGWEFLPYDIDFTRPEFYSSSRSPYTFLNGLRTGEIRIADQASGRVLTFVSSFITDRDENGDFYYGGVDLPGGETQAIPDEFIQGGSEQPDGSTLTQDRATLNYTLTRPDGTRVVFDSGGRLMAMQDARDRTVSYGYASGRVTTITDAAGQTVALSYDGQGRVNQAVGQGGEVVDYVYDANGDLVSADRVRQRDHITYSYTYDGDHRITSVTLPNQVTDSTSAADLMGRVTTRGDARGNQFDSDFDRLTRTTVTTDAISGTSQRRVVDDLGRTTELTDELGRTTSYLYLGTNRQPFIVQLPDPDRPLLMYLYDDNGNVTAAFDPERGGDADEDGIDDNPQSFEYDANNNLTRHTDARGIVTEYGYNSYNQRTSMTRAVGTDMVAAWTYEYDPATGFQIRETGPTGVVTEYDYDTRGNLTTLTVAPGTAAETVTSYVYDDFSRRTGEVNAGATASYGYNGRDKVTTPTLEGLPGAGDELVANITYSEAGGWKESDTDYAGNTTTYAYDAATGDLIGQRGAFGTPQEATTRLEYDRFGNVARITDPAGNVTVFQYDPLQRLVGTISLGSTPRVVDAVGSPTEVTLNFSGPIDTGPIDNGVDVFVQDEASQLAPGSTVFSADAMTLTWTPDSGGLVPGVYTITLQSRDPSEGVSNQAGILLDGEFFGAFPSGDNTAGGDFVYGWIVDDHGNDAEHATLSAVPAGLSGELEFEGDADWFRLDAVAGNRFTFEVVLDSLPDSMLRLYGPDGKTILEENDDIDRHTGQYASRIEWEAPRTGAYYLSVRAYNDREVGTYQLHANLLQDDHADDAEDATEVVVTSVNAGRLEIPTDGDFFCFDAVGGETYRFATILGSLEDSVLTLYRRDGGGLSVIGENDDFGGGKASLLHWQTPLGEDGAYYVAVRSFGDQHEGAYELAVSTDDHMDDSAEATEVSPGSAEDGNIEVRGDHDWFSFQTTENANYRVEVIPDATPDGPETAVLAVYGPDLELIDSDTSNSPAVVYFTASPAARTYFARARGLNDSTGSYQFVVTQVTDDHGDDAVGAAETLVPGVTDGELGMPDDEDWFAFTVTDGHRYQLTVSLDTLHDSYLTLYDTDGTTEILANDDRDGLGSGIDWYAPVAGTYYAAVRSYDRSFAGTYSLSIQEAVAETIPPVCSVLDPTPGDHTPDDLGYVDVVWDDLGAGINEAAIDPTDLEIVGVTFSTVGLSPSGSGAWRYEYAGSLPEGIVEIVIPAGGVADVAGNWNEETRCTFVYDSQAPVVDAGTDQTVGEGATVNLQGTFTDAVDIGSYVVEIDWDDGTVETLTVDQGVGAVSGSHLYDGDGVFTMTLTVTDATGNAGSDTLEITVVDAVQPAAGIAGRHVFYNNSSFDGNTPASNEADDDAIAREKQALVPGGLASAANYTGYWRGINGIMVDIHDIPGAPADNDFRIRVNEAADSGTWSAGPVPIVSVRSGEGVDESDRVTLVWADGEIRNRWVEVTVLATANTGLVDDDVFYFGNSVGDCDGDGEVGSSDYGTFVSEFGLRGGLGTLAADLSGDGRVDLTDFAIVRDASGNSVLAPTIPAAAPEAPSAALVATLQAAAEPITGAATPVISIVSQPLDDNDASDDSIATTKPALAVDLLVESPSAAGYISGPQPISAGTTATTLYRAATAEYDLRPLNDDLPADEADDPLADILAESPLAVPL